MRKQKEWATLPEPVQMTFPTLLVVDQNSVYTLVYRTQDPETERFSLSCLSGVRAERIHEKVGLIYIGDETASCLSQLRAIARDILVAGEPNLGSIETTLMLAGNHLRIYNSNEQLVVQTTTIRRAFWAIL